MTIEAPHASTKRVSTRLSHYPTSMSIIGMTLLAKLRDPLLDEGVIHATVRVMASGAVFGDWGMLPQERTAFFRMTAIASVIDRGFF